VAQSLYSIVYRIDLNSYINIYIKIGDKGKL